jgi:DNA-binding winged helix-turn-helix (wHTH) protein
MGALSERRDAAPLAAPMDPAAQPDPRGDREISRSREDSSFAFGRYRLLPGARLLLCEGRAVALGSRAFDLLHILLRSRGTVVTKEEIVRHVWPCTLVEESNLRFQMASLRKALGPDRDFIKTIPGRGYLLVAGPADGLAAAAQAADGLADVPRAAPGERNEAADGLRSLLRSVLAELRELSAERGRALAREPGSGR